MKTGTSISLPSLCKIIWRHWTYKMPVTYILSSVWVWLSIFSQLSIIQSIIRYVGLCVFSLPTPLLMIERIYTLSYYHHQIGSMNYDPLFRVRSWNNGVRCMSFYILIEWIRRYTMEISKGWFQWFHLQWLDCAKKKSSVLLLEFCALVMPAFSSRLFCRHLWLAVNASYLGAVYLLIKMPTTLYTITTEAFS